MSWLSEALEDIEQHTIRPIAKEVKRTTSRITAEYKREADWAIEQEKRWLKSKEFKVTAAVVGGAIAGPAIIGAAGGVIDTLANVLPKVGGIVNSVEDVLGKEDQPAAPVSQAPSTQLPTSSQPIINLTAPASAIPAGSTGGIVLTTPPAEQPNFMLYIGLGILAIILLKG